MVGEIESEQAGGLADVVPLHQQNFRLIDNVVVDVANSCATSCLVDNIAKITRRISQFESAPSDGRQTLHQMAAITQAYLFQNASKMEGKHVGLIVSSHSSGISGVVSDAERLLPHVTWSENELRTFLKAGQNNISVTLSLTSSTTAIKSVNGNRLENGEYYSLNGVKVENPSKGIYIKNGKKVIL